MKAINTPQFQFVALAHSTKNYRNRLIFEFNSAQLTRTPFVLTTVFNKSPD